MEELNFKKLTMFGFMLGVGIGYFLYRTGIQINDGTGEVARFISSNPVALFAFLGVMSSLMLVLILHNIYGWIKLVFRERRIWKRLKRIKQIKRYGYVSGIK